MGGNTKGTSTSRGRALRPMPPQQLAALGPSVGNVATLHVYVTRSISQSPGHVLHLPATSVLLQLRVLCPSALRGGATLRTVMDVLSSPRRRVLQHWTSPPPPLPPPLPPITFDRPLPLPPCGADGEKGGMDDEAGWLDFR